MLKCPSCGKWSKTKGALWVHKSTYHRLGFSAAKAKKEWRDRAAKKIFEETPIVHRIHSNGIHQTLDLFKTLCKNPDASEKAINAFKIVYGLD